MDKILNETLLMKKRECNYDLLRICSAFAVVMLHVSGGFLLCNDAGVPENCNFPVMLLNHIVRFAVPCFFMLSGAFILADGRNADYKYFYRKSIKNIGITGIIFCMLYVIYGLVRLIVSVFVLHRHRIEEFIPRLSSIVFSMLQGQPEVHLWYLFMLIGLYIAVPFVIRLAANLHEGGVNIYGKITTIYLALASVSYITSEHVLKWDIGWQFCFLSYFLMGYKLRKWSENRKSNAKAIKLIVCGLSMNIGLGYINYCRGLNGLPVDVGYFAHNPFSYAPLAPLEVIASCMIFAGFSVMKIGKDFSKLAGYTFLIYLIHAGIWDLLYFMIGDRMIGNSIVEGISIIVISVVVFITSLLGAIIYNFFAIRVRRISGRNI